MARDDEQREEPIPQPSRMSELGHYIRHQRETAKLSLRNLAKLAGVSNPYLSQIERGLRKPSAEILQAIARALSISSETLYVKAGILEERDPEASLEAAIERERMLTDGQKTALIEMYRSFRRLNAFEGGDSMLAGDLDTSEDAEPVAAPAPADQSPGGEASSEAVS